MKHFYLYLLLFLCTISFGQKNLSYDYFVQFNGDNLAKKVTVAEILDHNLVQKFSQGSPLSVLKQLDGIIKFDQKVFFQGSIKDTASYYQITIPVKSHSAVKQFITDNIATKDAKAIQDFANYSLYTKQGNRISMAWNNDYLVVFQYLKKYQNVYKTEIDVPAEEKLEDSIGGVEEEELPNEQDFTENNSIQDLDVLQEAYLKSVFEKGFVVPKSDKVSAKADISFWADYSSMFGQSSSFYRNLFMQTPLRNYMPLASMNTSFVKGMNVNFYFNKENLRIEQSTEYSEDMTKTMKKIIKRKINRNIYNYFPSQNPMAYMSYHFNTEELLNNFPMITNQIFGQLPPYKEELSIITDLVSTLLDEKAASTLFDGDLSLFLHDVSMQQITTKTFEYDENYEQKEVEQTYEDVIPLFSVVFTSTHLTLGDKLLKLGVNKGVLKAEGNKYHVLKADKFGDLFIIKDKDVIVIANTADYFSLKSKGDFNKEIKSDLRKNYFIGKANFPKMAQRFSENNKSKTADSFLKKISEQFEGIEMHAPKKMRDNKFTYEFTLNSTKADKNIILQFLDAFQMMR